MTTHPRRPSGAGRPDPSHLLSGYATDTLSQAERSRLYRAALEDQRIFDQLVEEESWRQVFSAAGVREELLQALAEPAPAATVVPGVRRPGVAAGRRPSIAAGGRAGSAPEVRGRGASGGLRNWLAGFRVRKRGSGRYMPPLVMGTAAAALLAIALVPRWLELGVPGPVDRGEEAPRVAESSPPPTEFIAKSYDPQRGTTEEPPTELVPKSYGGAGRERADSPLQPTSELLAQTAKPGSATTSRGLRPKSTTTGVLNISYTLELNQPGGPREVPEGWVFRAGDQFRLRLAADFRAWLYLFNRAGSEAVYTVLYPHIASERAPVPPSDQDVLVPAEDWLTLDATPADEQLVLVVSTQPWPVVAGRVTVPAGELEAALAAAESSFASLNWRRSETDDRVQLAVEESDSPVMVLRLLGIPSPQGDMR